MPSPIEIIQTVLILASVILVWIQLRKQTMLAQSANVQQLVAISSPYNLELINNKHMADLWVNGANREHRMDAVEKDRFHSLLSWWLMLHENIYYQHRQGFLEESIFVPWQRDLQHFAIRQRLWKYWPEMEIFFQEDFAAYVGQILNDLNPPQHPEEDDASKVDKPEEISNAAVL